MCSPRPFKRDNSGVNIEMHNLSLTPERVDNTFHREVIEIRLPYNDAHVENIDPVDEIVDILQDFIGTRNTNDGENEDDMGDDMAMRLSVSGQQYDELFSEVEAELYPGCTSYSSLNFFGQTYAFESNV
ncbi:LOW QUALITY PROTEIN: hypothetical protein TorRG33x02_083790 [Trema orientale]|uniref:Uncharacterized protein n=1 Tax=Trema orientale TaxID=63057 RepID=A0A2P5FDM5_TREOI|nr:LOW QUALITY PROTEIN: hypothetical protein TorRG33x02_083790 [Trema orientale]